MSAITIENGWASDANGNRASVLHWGSEESARASLATLTACRDCTNCSRCSDCSGCSRCSDCYAVKRVEAPIVVGPKRSDGWQFVIGKDGKVHAGCRVFKNFPDAYRHWADTRGGTPLGDETVRILDWCQAEATARRASA